MSVERRAPYNLDVETALLGMLMFDPAQLHEVAQALAPGDFFRDAHSTVYERILDRYNAGKRVAFDLVIEDLEASGDLKKVGGDEAFEEMSRRGVTPADAPYYAAVVKQHSIARSLIAAADETMTEACSRQHTAESLIASAQERIFAIAQAHGRDGVVDVGKVADEAFDLLVRRMEGEVSGIATGFDSLDNIIGSLPNSGLVILAARPSMGKTSLAMNICEYNALRLGVPCLFVSLEMARQELGMRILASQSRIPGKKFQFAVTHMSMDDLARVAEARNRMKNGRLYIDHTPGRTVAQIAASARLHKAKSGIGLIVIDYMSLINMQARRGESRQEEVARTSRQLKELAKSLDIPVLVLCQLNRAVESRDDKRPRMSDLRESGQIEQDADIILFVHRPEKYDPEDRPGEADVLVAKNRFGATGAARLTFLKELTRFENMAHPSQAADDWCPED